MDEWVSDIGSLSDAELKVLIGDLAGGEREISYNRRILHGKIDLLRAELVNRLRERHNAGNETITDADVAKLTDLMTSGWGGTDVTPGNGSSRSKKGEAQTDSFPDLGSLDDIGLKDLIRTLTDEEREISYKRRILHGKIDILRAELVNRMRTQRQEGVATITGEDIEQLTEILAGRAGKGADEAVPE